MLINGTGVTVTSSVAATGSREMVTQHPRDTSMIAVDVTLKYSSAAGGVTIALEVLMGSPSIVKATAMAPAVPPVGTAILPFALT
jgi:hypothetical protein